MKILLLQARRLEDAARLDERRSFALRAKVDQKVIVPFDLLKGTPTIADVQRYDALMIGGSGDFYVSKGNLPTHERVLTLLRDVVDLGHPMFASCFGFHLLVEALGGKVIYDPENMEVGTYELTLNAAGQRDDLFNLLPHRFKAQLGHKDRVDRIPGAGLNLSSSKSAPYQAMRIPGKPIWATQFHPELSGEDNLKRFHQYLRGYSGMMDDDEVEKTIQRFEPSPETDQLISRFLTIIS